MKKSILTALSFCLLAQGAAAHSFLYKYVEYEQYDLNSVPSYDRERVRRENEKIESDTLASILADFESRCRGNVDLTQQERERSQSKFNHMTISLYGICIENADELKIRNFDAN